MLDLVVLEIAQYLDGYRDYQNFKKCFPFIGPFLGKKCAFQTQDDLCFAAAYWPELTQCIWGNKHKPFEEIAEQARFLIKPEWLPLVFVQRLPNGFTPLQWVCWSDNVRLLQVMHREWGYDILDSSDGGYEVGEHLHPPYRWQHHFTRLKQTLWIHTHIQAAIYNDSRQVLRYLLENDHDFCSGAMRQYANIVFEYPFQFNLMEYASVNGQLGCQYLLSQHLCDLFVAVRQGQSAIDDMTRDFETEAGSAQVLLMLIVYGTVDMVKKVLPFLTNSFGDLQEVPKDRLENFLASDFGIPLGQEMQLFIESKGWYTFETYLPSHDGNDIVDEQALGRALLPTTLTPESAVDCLIQCFAKHDYQTLVDLLGMQVFIKVDLSKIDFVRIRAYRRLCFSKTTEMNIPLMIQLLKSHVELTFEPDYEIANVVWAALYYRNISLFYWVMQHVEQHDDIPLYGIHSIVHQGYDDFLEIYRQRYEMWSLTDSFETHWGRICACY